MHFLEENLHELSDRYIQPTDDSDIWKIYFGDEGYQNFVEKLAIFVTTNIKNTLDAPCSLETIHKYAGVSFRP